MSCWGADGSCRQTFLTMTQTSCQLAADTSLQNTCSKQSFLNNKLQHVLIYSNLTCLVPRASRTFSTPYLKYSFSW